MSFGIPGISGGISGGEGGLSYSPSSEAKGEQGGSGTGDKIFGGSKNDNTLLIVGAVVAIGLVLWLQK